MTIFVLVNYLPSFSFSHHLFHYFFNDFLWFRQNTLRGRFCTLEMILGERKRERKFCCNFTIFACLFLVSIISHQKILSPSLSFFIFLFFFLFFSSWTFSFLFDFHFGFSHWRREIFLKIAEVISMLKWTLWTVNDDKCVMWGELFETSTVSECKKKQNEKSRRRRRGREKRKQEAKKSNYLPVSPAFELFSWTLTWVFLEKKSSP